MTKSIKIILRADFNGARIKDDLITATFPPKSVVVLEIK